MIADSFDSRTLANMEVALERACKILPTGAEQHETTPGGLTEAGITAATELWPARVA